MYVYEYMCTLLAIYEYVEIFKQGSIHVYMFAYTYPWSGSLDKHQEINPFIKTPSLIARPGHQQFHILLCADLLSH